MTGTIKTKISSRQTKLFSVVCSLIFTLSVLTASGQLKNVSLSAGLVTTQILGDNPGTWPIIERDASLNHDIGGSFKGNQPGFGLRLNLPVDKDGLFIAPVGFDYIYFRALERVPIATKTTLFLMHSVSVPTATLGMNYFFLKFPIANVRAFAGLEARGSFVQEGDFYRRFEYGNFDSVAIIDTKTKSSVFRLGGALKLGIEGEFLSPWYVTTGVSLDAMNLIGKDGNRGELLTPMKSFENKESLVLNLHFLFMIQYKFN